MTQQQPMTTPNMSEFPDYPLPDTAWDYAEAWESCQKVKANLEILLAEMSNYEEASPEKDRESRHQLTIIWGNVAAAQNCLRTKL